MTIKEKLEHSSVRRLTRLAAVLALSALALMAYSIVFPRPLPVILAMSVGHAIGIAAFACYLLAVILDVSRSAPPPDSLSPAPPRHAPPPPPSRR